MSVCRCSLAVCNEIILQKSDAEQQSYVHQYYSRIEADSRIILWFAVSICSKTSSLYRYRKGYVPNVNFTLEKHRKVHHSWLIINPIVFKNSSNYLLTPKQFRRINETTSTRPYVEQILVVSSYYYLTLNGNSVNGSRCIMCGAVMVFFQLFFSIIQSDLQLIGCWFLSRFFSRCFRSVIGVINWTFFLVSETFHSQIFINAEELFSTIRQFDEIFLFLVPIWSQSAFWEPQLAA